MTLNFDPMIYVHQQQKPSNNPNKGEIFHHLNLAAKVGKFLFFASLQLQRRKKKCLEKIYVNFE